MIENKETIAAIATAPGRGGIGVVRVSGPQASDIYISITGETPVARQVKYCRFKDPDGVILDKGLALFFSAPASYTGEDVVELHGHGGQTVLNIILKQTLSLGARLAKPGEFTERAYLNDKLDLLQAESISDLINSTSEQAVRSAMRSLDGEFSNSINFLVEELVNIRVFVEGALDFPEEEIDFLSGSDIRERIENCLLQLDNIFSRASEGRVLREGISVVIVGSPNVGKSSLLNALSRTNKAIVTDHPGTTRDIIEDCILVDGLRLNIIDTAGIRETVDSVELEGIKRAKNAAAEADLLIVVREAVPMNNVIQNDLEARLPAVSNRIIVHNKIDLVGITARANSEKDSTPEVFLSAKTHEGVGLLIEQIKQVAGIVNSGEDTLSARTRHIEALAQAREQVKKALDVIENKKPAAELLAEDLQQAHQYLGRITGESSADDLLGEIFSSFCIGK